MDIDQIITNNVDDILTFPVSIILLELIVLGGYQNLILINLLTHHISIITFHSMSGFYKFKSGELSYVWDDL